MNQEKTSLYLNCKEKNSWGIITTLKGDAQQTMDFVNYHLNVGVNHILLYFDDPNDFAIELLRNKKKVTCIPCTERHWQSIEIIEHRCILEKKQLSNIKHGKEILYGKGIRWGISIDSDELLFVCKKKKEKNSTISEILLEQSEKIGVIRVKSYESIITKDQYNHRSFMAKWFMVQPSDKKFFTLFFYKILNYNRKGVINDEFFLGHTEGKSFFRVNLDFLKINQHSPIVKSKKVKYIESKELKLLHFDCMLYEKWKERWLWRVSGGINSVGMGPQRLKQFKLISDVANKESDKKLKKLYKKWFFVGYIKLFLLRITHQVRQIDINDETFNESICYKK